MEKIKPEKKQKVEEFIKGLYTEKQIDEMISEGVYDYLDDDWDENYESEHEWYRDFGSGEVETSIFDGIIKKVDNEFDLPDDWYLKDHIDDFDDIVYDNYPQLKTL